MAVTYDSSSATIARRSASLIVDQAAICSRVRPQAVQAPSSTVQTFTQGLVVIEDSRWIHEAAQLYGFGRAPRKAGSFRATFIRTSHLHDTMGAFSIYIRYRGDADRTAAELLEGFVEAYDGVDLEPGTVDADADPGLVVPENGLDIEDIDTFASVFAELEGNPAVHDVSLWGPGSMRFPVRVYHHALRGLSDPDAYQFHAIDDRETLLVCESPAALERAREEIGAAGLVEAGEAKF